MQNIYFFQNKHISVDKTSNPPFAIEMTESYALYVLIPQHFYYLFKTKKYMKKFVKESFLKSKK
jgi:hypothetical protein